GSSCRSRSSISAGGKPAASGTLAGALEPASGVYRGSRSHLKIMLAFVAERRAACATDTPGAVV
ncbi:MAG: hypothetical protein ACI9ZH_001925, partial [Paracoccaceae bacterium]